MDKERFSLLLLEPGEIYFEDLSVYLCTPDQCFGKRQNDIGKLGRLKICSKSLVFEPKDIMKPLIKMKFEHCVSIEEIVVPDRERLTSNSASSALCVDCTKHVEMLQGNIIAPYTHKEERWKFAFKLIYGRVEECVRRIGQLHRANSLPASEQGPMLQVIEDAMQVCRKFDRLWLQDMYEQVVLETTATRITPLVVNPGMVLISNATLYFQSYNNIQPNNLLKINLPEIRSITKRRFALKHVGCEVEFNTRSGLDNLFLRFAQPSERDHFYNCLLKQPVLRLADVDRERMTLCWQNGMLSNYEYLLYLNSEADRTFNDLTQYPVFPWVVQDYSSDHLDLLKTKTFRDLTKPIGALNPVKLQRLKERYDEMADDEDKFLYGSHYSAPGLVLFYLTRLYPHYMLCLNNGSFDKPDRMFNCVADVWRNVLTNNADFKELVPEFYDTSSEGEFLCNNYGINFGYRSDNIKVGDVELPPWANGPGDFVRKMREALESEPVSRNLHHWIDLIFGYKQLGEESIKADNLFCKMSYEGAVDLDSITDWSKRHALEVQIMEFGQVPRQIFQQPHPRRSPISIERPISLTSPDTRPTKLWSLVPTLTLNHREAVTAATLSDDGSQAVTVSRGGVLKIHTVSTGRQERSATLSPTPLSSLVAFLPTSIVVGSWDSNIVTYDVACGRVTDSMLGHEDAVTCLVWAADRQLLVSGSWDCCVRLWRVQSCPPIEPIRPATDLITELEHNAKVICMDVNRRDTQLASGTEDGEICVWSLASYSLLYQLTDHSGSVNCVKFSSDGKKLVSCADDRSFKLFDFTCGGMQTFSKELDQELKCLVWTGPLLVVGGSRGDVFIWDMVRVTLLERVSAHEGAVLCLDVSEQENVLISGGEDKKLLVWKSDSR